MGGSGSMSPLKAKNARPSSSTFSSSPIPSPAMVPQWSPAALLNPKGGMKPQKVDLQQAAATYQKPAPPMTFSFDTPQSSSTFNPPSNAEFAYNNGGFGSMMERMHNVKDRDMAPPSKRQKREEDGQEDNKAQFSGGGKGGVLGQYIHDKREEGRKEAQAHGTAPAVDLTGDDDDSLTIMESPEDKEVCYGRIEGAQVNAFRVPTSRTTGSGSLGPGYWPQVKVMLKRREADKTTVIHVADATRNSIGCVDVVTAIGLCPIMDGNLGIRFSARILARPKKIDDLPPGSETSTRYSLDLTLYGPHKYANRIGAALSQKQLYLRTPLFVEAGIMLVNPHTILKPPEPARNKSSIYSSTGGYAQRTVEEIRNDVIGMFDRLEQAETLPEMDADSRIKTELLPHQKQGLYFMTKKEQERTFGENSESNSLWRLRYGNGGQKFYVNVITSDEERQPPPQVLGGILADMMGLGKTLSILALVVSTLDSNKLKAWTRSSPPAAINDEIQVRKNSKTTLLVAPLSTITNWEDQIAQHLKPGTLKVHIYHGPNRIKDVSRLSQFDLVITTYGSVASEFNKRAKKDGKYPLEEIGWFRIVLDEAHMIREQSTLQSKAICRLTANRRWAVTGTPVQNRLEDLGALMKFLRIKPFDNKAGFAQYIIAPCKNSDPDILPKIRLLVDSITLRRLKDKIDLPPRHDYVERLQFSAEEQQIYDVFAKNASDRVSVLTNSKTNAIGGKAYVHILQSILRLRLICAHGKELLGEEDLKIMEGLNKASAIDLDSDEDSDKPALSEEAAYNMYRLMRETNADNCEVCTTKIGTRDEACDEEDSKSKIIAYMTPCYHVLCTTCINSYKERVKSTSTDGVHATCIVCQQENRMTYVALKQNKIDADEDAHAEIKDSGSKQKKKLGNYGGPHTKTRALLEDLHRSQQESELLHGEPPIKSVVFSGWTSHLDLIAVALENAGIKATRLDGKMTRTARAQAMETFRDDPSITVILVSIMAGGMGLNLTSASKVYVMEPQYNPAAEAQAVDRVHRLGQKREVHTVRYIMEDSFEVKILELQKKKIQLAKLSMDKEKGERGQLGREEATKQRLEDLKSLFR